MASDGRKQKVLHTRVPEDLERELKAKAAKLGISVSNLVRNVLHNTLDLVEDVIVDSARIADSAQHLVRERQETQSPPRVDGMEVVIPHSQGSVRGDPSPEEVQPRGDVVLGWQELVLNLNALCVECNGILPRGSRAAIGVMRGGGPPPTLCVSCLQGLVSGSKEAS